MARPQLPESTLFLSSLLLCPKQEVGSRLPFPFREGQRGLLGVGLPLQRNKDGSSPKDIQAIILPIHIFIGGCSKNKYHHFLLSAKKKLLLTLFSFTNFPFQFFFFLHERGDKPELHLLLLILTLQRILSSACRKP